MKCSYIKKLFSQYLEGDLGEKENTLISEHLKACNKCSKELDLLKETVSLLKTRESVQPPPDFVVQVRKKIEVRRWWKEAVRLIFIPWHIKIPVEAIATILITCLLYYIFQQQIPPVSVPKIEKKAILTEEIRDISREMKEDKLSVELQKVADYGKAPSFEGKGQVIEDTKLPPKAIQKSYKELPKKALQFKERRAAPLKAAEYYRFTKHKDEAEHWDSVALSRGVEDEVGQLTVEDGLPEITTQELREKEVPLLQEELHLALKRPKKDLLKIKTYLSLLNAENIKERVDEITGERVISFQIKEKDYLRLAEKLIQMEAIEPREVKETVGEEISVRLKIR